MDAPVPAITYNFAPTDGHNIFRERFGFASDDEWLQILDRSLINPIVDSIQFPSFPNEDFQSRIHGNSGASATAEAADFFRFVKKHTYRTDERARSWRLLDFGTGWGRMIRPFMRDFELKHLYGFDPNYLFVSLARMFNPYLQFLSGNFVPGGDLPESFFDLMIGWSVFSHLSPSSATLWLRESARCVKPGGICVFTTWGDRFLTRLSREAAERDEGKDIHWYSSVCINSAGSLADRIAEYETGKFVWFTNSDSLLWGEAFISEAAMRKILWDFSIPFEIVFFDQTTLSQDAFVLRRL